MSFILFKITVWYFLGTHILQTLSEGKYAGETYSYHLQASANSLILLTNRKIFHLKKSIMSSSWEIDWLEAWENCDKVIQDSGKRLRILLKVSLNFKDMKRQFSTQCSTQR